MSTRQTKPGQVKVQDEGRFGSELHCFEVPVSSTLLPNIGTLFEPFVEGGRGEHRVESWAIVIELSAGTYSEKGKTRNGGRGYNT